MFKNASHFNWIAIAFAILIFASLAAANPIVNFQGVLENTETGEVVPDGQYDFQFKIYTQATGGSSVWSEPHNDQPVADGIYSVNLGAASSLAVLDFTAHTYYMEITVNGNALSPRQQITYNLAAMWAEEAEHAVNADTALVAQNYIISPGSITNLMLADGCVNSAKIENLQVQRDDIANDAIDSTKIQNGTIASSDIRDGTIQPVDLGFPIGDIVEIAAGSGIIISSPTGPVPTISATLGTDIVSTEIVNETILSEDIQNGTIGPVDLNFVPGDVTDVTAGNGVTISTPGGPAPSVAVNFSGSGSANTVSRSDHAHTGYGDITDVNAGIGINVTSPGGPAPTVSATLGTDITSSEIVDGEVYSADIHDETITSTDILNGTIQVGDLNFTPGDITDVNAGTGISVTNSSGPSPTVSATLGTSINSAEIEDGTIQQVDLGITVGDITDVNAGTGISVTSPSGPSPTVSAILGTSVNSTEIEDGQVQTADIGADQVTSAKIPNGAIGTSEIADGSIALADLGLGYTPGDLTSVIAGSGISVSSSSGPDPTVSISSSWSMGSTWNLTRSTAPLVTMTNQTPSGEGDVLDLSCPSTSANSISTDVLYVGTNKGNACLFDKAMDDNEWDVYIFSPNSTSEGLYVYGRAVATGGWGLDLLGAGGQRRELSAVYSNKKSFYITGTATLSQGRSYVAFDAEVRDIISTDEPLRVFFTPKNGWSGLYMESSSGDGFHIASGAGDQNITFDWFAIAPIKEREIPRDMQMSPEDRAKELQLGIGR